MEYNKLNPWKVKNLLKEGRVEYFKSELLLVQLQGENILYHMQ